jgi:hypothetical protein
MEHPASKPADTPIIPAVRTNEIVILEASEQWVGGPVCWSIERAVAQGFARLPGMPLSLAVRDFSV